MGEISKKEKSFENESENEDEENNEDKESESKEEVIPEPLAPNRLRRANAGNKMAELMKEAIADDFYESAYSGGFKEDDVDDNFMPAVNTNSDDDEVDSDFDQPEEEDEFSGDETEDNRLKKEEKKALLAKNRSWAAARFNKFIVNENSCDAKTQQQRLEDAKETEKLNIISLKRFEEFELERKKKQAKPLQKKRPTGPLITTISRSEPYPHTIVVVPEIKQFTKPERIEYRVCAVTGRPARYVDPLTDLPYANLDAFKQIRASYKEYLQSVSIISSDLVLPEPMDTT